MKKRMIQLIQAFVFIWFFASTVPSAVHADTFKLTYSNFFPPTHIQSKLAQSWCDEIEKRTNGRVVVQYFPGQTLTKSTQVYDGVVVGLSDVGLALFGYTRGRFPVMEAVDLPMGYKSGSAATRVVNEVYQEFKPEELMDTQVMYLHAHGPGILHTKGKAVRKLEDFAGMKLRGHGTSAMIVRAVGGTSVTLAMPELYQSLQKNVVQGALYPVETNKGWRMGEVTDHITNCTSIAYTSSFYVVMNKDKWAAFPDDIKEIITKINEEWVVKHGEAWNTSDDEGLEFVKSLGHEIIELDDAEAARWEKAMAPVFQDYIDKMNKLGFDGQKIVDFVKQSLKKNQS